MNAENEIICFGDLMLECILRVPQLPAPVGTLVTDGRPREPGGAAYNLAWYFAQWGYRARLVAVAGTADEGMVGPILRNAGVLTDGLIPTAGETDYLLVFEDGSRHWAVYLRAGLPEGAEARVIERCRPADVLVVTGSRHPRLRATAGDIARAFTGRMLAFTPSYALHEYTAEEFLAVARPAHLVTLNEHELAFALSRTGAADGRMLSEQLGGMLLITRAERGAVLYRGGDVWNFPSVSNRSGDVIGAGDSFFAGFLHTLLRGGRVEEAGAVAAQVAARLIASGAVRAKIPRAAIDSFSPVA